MNRNDLEYITKKINELLENDLNNIDDLIALGNVKIINKKKQIKEYDYEEYLDQLYQWTDVEIDSKEWIEILNTVKNTNNRKIAVPKGIFVNDLTKIELEQKRAHWDSYRINLKSKYGEETTTIIGDEAYKIMRYLMVENNSDKSNKIIQGLAVGYVQSGKTTSMASVISMALDAGINFIVVLTGSIESLRVQTETRLKKDLIYDIKDNTKFNNVGQKLEFLTKNDIDSSKNVLSQTGGKLLSNLDLEIDGKKYIYVCLKNNNILKNLLGWINHDKKFLNKLRMLVIDDESDNISVDTSYDESERKKINKLIRVLLKKDDPLKSYNVTNYLMYTATPYANVLRGSTEEDLYPKDFICNLTPGNEYIGAKNIFGLSEPELFYSSIKEEEINYDILDGLDIIRTVNEDDLEIVQNISIENGDLPESLKDSISWFINCLAYFRFKKINKPISMLVHTHSSINKQQKIYDNIIHFVKTKKEEILVNCEKIWEIETNRFDYSQFVGAMGETYNKYGLIDNIIMKDYPKYCEIKEYIPEIISDISNIQLSEDNKQIIFKKNLHISLDNSKNNKIDENGNIKRLHYPSEDLDFATGFIVVGGHTLSRGLTLEGLTTTYFTRVATNADTLMQMGRFFGYKVGYELLPRIWMDIKNIKKYMFLADMEEDLRNSISNNEIMGVLPLETGPSIMKSPYTSFGITTKAKMKGAILNVNYSGYRPQTTVFENNEEILKNNKQILINFVLELKSQNVFEEFYKENNNYVFKAIDYDFIFNNFISKYKFSKNQLSFSDIQSMNEWIKKYTNKTWNLVLIGINKTIDGSSLYIDNEIILNKVNRSRRTKGSDKETINIGVLRSPVDLLRDIKKDKLGKINSKIILSDIEKIRKENNVGDIPLLKIYLIDQNSIFKDKDKNNKNAQNQSAQIEVEREDLKAVDDIVGISILLPQINNAEKSKYTVQTNFSLDLFDEEEDN